MSILIKGMEMPTHCLDCPFMVSRDNDDCILQSAEANESFENWEQMKADCPLIELPPHGRLIDADEMKESIRKQAAFLKIMGGEFAKIAETLEKGFLQEIDNAPTIIPAEPAEEGET